MKRFACAIVLLAALPYAAAAQGIPVPSAALLAALSVVREAGITPLAEWAPEPVSPSASGGQVAAAEAQILALPAPDRDALLYWLAAHGRGALHARGVTDADIGVPYFPLDYLVSTAPFPISVTPLNFPSPAPPPTPVPTPQPRHRSHFGFLGSLLPALQLPIASTSSSSSSMTTTQSGSASTIDKSFSSSGASVSIGGNPWEALGSLIDASIDHSPGRAAAPAVPWRPLPFAQSSLSAPGSRIAVTRGFAAVRDDGGEGVACISFANQSAKTATQIDVDIEILDGLGFIKRVRALRRAGNFAPGAEVGGPAGPQTIAEARANCVIDGENDLDDPSDPFASASGVAYAIRQVSFADGSSWLQPEANPWSL